VPDSLAGCLPLAAYRKVPRGSRMVMFPTTSWRCMSSCFFSDSSCWN